LQEGEEAIIPGKNRKGKRNHQTKGNRGD